MKAAGFMRAKLIGGLGLTTKPNCMYANDKPRAWIVKRRLSGGGMLRGVGKLGGTVRQANKTEKIQCWEDVMGVEILLLAFGVYASFWLAVILGSQFFGPR
jgi:hypothetical protein